MLPAPLRLLAVLAVIFAAPSLPSARADGPPCDGYEAEYSLAANFKLTDTFLGAGNGVFPTGPGKVVLRWSREADRVSVEMLSYELHQPFTMNTSALLWSAKLFSNTTATATPDARGVVTTGLLRPDQRELRWEGPVNGYRVDGTVQCDGSLCGRFGAPPPGTSPVHLPPNAVPFNAFHLSADRTTFTMDYAVVARADSPKQTTLIALAGREVRRVCVK